MTASPPLQSDDLSDEVRTLRTDLLRFLMVRERSVREVVTYLKRRGHAAHLISVCAK